MYYVADICVEIKLNKISLNLVFCSIVYIIYLLQCTQSCTYNIRVLIITDNQVLADNAASRDVNRVPDTRVPKTLPDPG